MTRKCFACGLTIGLKGIEIPDCDCGNDSNWHHHSVCKKCYFETCVCEMDGHDVSDCLKDETCTNHKKTFGLFHNWDDYDYHFKPKTTLLIHSNVMGKEI
jgi:hypothetical protein